MKHRRLSRADELRPLPPHHAMSHTVISQRASALLGPRSDDDLTELIATLNRLALFTEITPLAFERLDLPRIEVSPADEFGGPAYAIPNDAEILRHLSHKVNLRDFTAHETVSWPALFGALALALLHEASRLNANADMPGNPLALSPEQVEPYLQDYFQLASETLSIGEVLQTVAAKATKTGQTGARARHRKSDAAIAAFVTYVEQNKVKSIRDAAQRFIGDAPEGNPLFAGLGVDNLLRLLTEGHRRTIKRRTENP